MIRVWIYRDPHASMDSDGVCRIEWDDATGAYRHFRTRNRIAKSMVQEISRSTMERWAANNSFWLEVPEHALWDVGL